MFDLLTPSQAATLPHFVEEWIRIGWSTEPVNRPALRESLALVYSDILKWKLSSVVFLPSPRSAWMGAVLVGSGQVRQQVEQQVGQQVWQQVWQQVEQQVGQQVWQQVGQQVGQQVEQQVRQQVEQQVGQQVWQQVRQQNTFFFWPYLCGQFEASWWAWAEALQSLANLQYPPAYDLLKSLTACGPVYATEMVAVVSERPINVLRDSQGRLHADGQMALVWGDGFALSYWHGTHIPIEWGQINSEHWRPDWLLTTQNAEHRRVLIQGVGYDRIKSALPMTTLHTDRDMELVRVAQDVDVEPIVLLKVVCPSTQRPYVLRVPPQMTTCESARRWTLDLEADDDLVEER